MQLVSGYGVKGASFPCVGGNVSYIREGEEPKRGQHALATWRLVWAKVLRKDV